MCTSKIERTQTRKIEKENNFDWLLGKWSRTNEEQGKLTFENWKKESSSAYVGHGFTLKGKDTLSQEFMHITKRAGTWHLEVKTPQEKTATPFEFVSLDAQKFEFKNDTIDFPNVIRYWKKGETLYALVSGKDFTLDYVFVKSE
jgi:hypothetical protein